MIFNRLPFRVRFVASVILYVAVFGAFMFGVLHPLDGEHAEAATAAAAPSAVSSVKFDFDGDGSADIGRWEVSSNKMKVRHTAGGTLSEYTVGDYGAKPAPGNFNGDLFTDFATFKDGTWSYRPGPTPNPSATPYTISLGAAGDIPVAADYDGDGTTDAAVYRPSTSTWYIRKSSTATTISQTWGQAGDIPVVGDYDDDGKSDLAVWRPSSGYWYIVQSSNSTSFSNQWGEGATDIPIPGDYNGDGQTEIAVFRRTTGVWYMKTSPGYTSWTTQSWGNLGDQPVPADYDGDGKDDFAVWRPTTGVWYLVYSDDNYSINTFTLGEAVDRAVPAAYLKQVGGAVLPDELAASRLSPRNSTGNTDYYSQNFSWGRSLVSLPGRAGMDLSLGISYNSLVWTRSGEDLFYDVDRGNAGPGFRLGFPEIEPVYYDGAKAKFAYMMVSASGARVEFRQTTVSDIYETADSTYAQLRTTGASNPNDPVDPITITVTTTDGTQMTYDWKPGVDRFVCERIMDRNGNYITIGYDTDGLLSSVTDTLGRVITVTNSDGYPTSITQNWKTDNGAGSTNDPKTWASFTYTTKTIDTNYFGPSVIGPPNDYQVKVLQKITYLDGSFTKFTYNSYGQVYKVEQHAPDSGTTEHVLNSATLDLSAPTETADVPRLNSTANYAENFNGGTAVTVDNSDPVALTNYALTGTLTIDSSMVRVGVSGHPNQLYARIHFGGSGWKEGLTLATEDCIGTVSDTSCTGTARMRWMWNDYEQDNTSLTYPLNPRLKESQVGDGTNTKKTSIAYHLASGTVAQFGLVKRVEVGDLTTVWKKTETDYNLSTAYTDKRIIGLPSEVRSWGKDDSTGTLQPAAKMTYDYDQGTFGDTALNQNLANVTQHDPGFGSSYISGRGNLTTVTRCDATLSSFSAPYTCSGGIASTNQYNTAGAVVAKTTPWDGTNTRTVRIGYADSWNATPTPTPTPTGSPSPTPTPQTYAYPTVVTDPAGSVLGESGHSSTVKYRFDIGANVEATSPAPHNQSYGKTTKRDYDQYGRLEKQSVLVNGTLKSYKRYDFPNNDGVRANVYSTIVDKPGSASGPDTADEVLSESWVDGAGRIFQSRVPHTFNTDGTTATWAATLTEYDKVGRVKKQSVPTQVNSSWAAAGDDSTRGFLWTHQKYDWMGRVVRKINTDGLDQTTLNDSDTIISYAGCGCAGGLETTIEGELVPRTDTSGTARRKQKSYQDVLGRTFKMETIDWAGGVYSRTEHEFSGRDQVTETVQTDLAADPDVSQTTTASYDGHGRLASSHKPEQRDGSTLKYTTYSYNQDDSIQTVTDARGAVTTYTYENVSGVPKRPLLTGISWTAPGGSGLADPTDVTFSYDSLGNRTAMTDGLGSVAYAYDSLSRLTSETRDFNDNLSEAPLIGGSQLFRLSYTYTLSGQLQSYTDPWGEEIEHSHDRAGRLNSVTGTSFGDVTNYADSPGYRAWGALKHLEYGSGYEADITYNEKLQPTAYTLDNTTDSLAATFDRTYEYYNDGRLKLLDNVATDALTTRYDRLFTYDHMGRVKEAKSGTEASGTTETNRFYLPYRQTYEYNAFGSVTERDSTLWNYTQGDWDFSYSITNNRVAGDGYDFDGRKTSDGTIAFQYDAAGSMVKSSKSHQYETTFYRDGTGGDGKRSQRRWDGEHDEWEDWGTVYFVNSSVLGRTVSETTGTGKKRYTYVFGAGAMIARQMLDENDEEHVAWKHTDPSGLSTRSTTVTFGFANFEPEELDGLSNNVGIRATVSAPERHQNAMSSGDRITFDDMTIGDCEADGVIIPCSMRERMTESLQLQIRDHNPSRGFSFRSIEIDRNLPCRRAPSAIYIPGYEWEVPNGPNTTENGETIINVGSTGVHPGEWFSLDSESLSRCIYDLLINRFATVNVHGTRRNAVSGVWFSPGTTWAVQAYDWASGFKTAAITIGLTVHYDTTELPNLSKPTWRQFETMVEEVAHVNQFLNMWAGMKPRKPDEKAPASSAVDPTYADAIAQWGFNYAAAVLGTPKGQDPYKDNSIEKPAKLEASTIVQDIRSKSNDPYGPCGK